MRTARTLTRKRRRCFGPLNRIVRGRRRILMRRSWAACVSSLPGTPERRSTSSLARRCSLSRSVTRGPRSTATRRITPGLWRRRFPRPTTAARAPFRLTAFIRRFSSPSESRGRRSDAITLLPLGQGVQPEGSAPERPSAAERLEQTTGEYRGGPRLRRRACAVGAVGGNPSEDCEGGSAGQDRGSALRSDGPSRGCALLPPGQGVGSKGSEGSAPERPSAVERLTPPASTDRAPAAEDRAGDSRGGADR